MTDYEKLGAFYLGRRFDVPQGALADDLVLYDSKDLTTHAVIVGMTGSGKTGLGVTLLEEAAIDAIPALIIDPKGDMGNLALRFPDLAPGDFAPWLEPDAAARKGLTPDAYADQTAATWRNGLADWGQPLERVRRLCDAADVAIYTPGSNAGLPLSVLKSLDAPPAAIRENIDAFRERIASCVSGLLALLDRDADPLRSREHVFLSNLLERTWSEGAHLDMPGLIRSIQSPPFTQVGIMDLESVFPAADRMQLAMTLNNLLASPGFAAWTQGEPLDIQRLLWTKEGKPRLSVLSIAHLGERERMFFVTILLNEVIAWMRAQSGTSSLRALLYMDEVFGYLPPTAMPPSKTPMLTLLKQARAYGLGLVLATQNPVDLDYKALSNAGTWFLGRLQTERDKERVLDGLEGASTAAGAAFDRQGLQRTLSSLGNRVFLMNNVHEDQPVTYQTRWALSYLRGPLTTTQIQKLMADRKALSVREAVPPEPASQKPGFLEKPGFSAPPPAQTSTAQGPPVLPPGITQRFAAVSRSTPRDAAVTYRPALLGTARVHFVDAQSRSGVDVWREVSCLASSEHFVSAHPWESATPVNADDLDLSETPDSQATFAELPSDAAQPKSYTRWKSALKDHFYRTQRLLLSFCPSHKMYSRPDETEGDFRARLQLSLREQRDADIEKLRKQYATKIDRVQDAIRRHQQRVETEKSQANSATMSTVVSFGTTVLSALFGRKLASSSNVSRAATSMRSASRAAGQRGDVRRAEENLEDAQAELRAQESELQSEIDRLHSAYAPESIAIEPYEVTARKSDLNVSEPQLIWLPFAGDAKTDQES